MAESAVVDDMKHCYENLILIDAGANLTNKKYSRDLDAVIQRAQDSGTPNAFHMPFRFHRFRIYYKMRKMKDEHDPSRSRNECIFKVHIFRIR